MANKSKKPASRGFVNNIILESLLLGDKYGYEIIKEVEEKSNGKIILKQPSLYSSLKRFEAKGFITSYWGDSDIGGRRHYYTITEMGKEYFKENVQSSAVNFFELDDETKDSKILADNITIDELVAKEETVVKNSDSDDKVINISVSNKNEETLNLQEDAELLEVKSDTIKEPSNNVIVNVDSPEYDIFNILENAESNNENLSYEIKVPNELSQSSKATNKPNEEVYIEEKDTSALPLKENINTNETEHAIALNMFNDEDEAENTLEEIRLDAQILQEIKQLNVALDDKVNDNSNEERKNNSTTTKPIPLIKEREQEYFSWEDLKRKLTSTINDESKRMNDEKSYAPYLNEESAVVSEKNEEVNEPYNTSLLQNEAVNAEPNLVKKDAKVVVDEFGILKSSQDTLPKMPKQIIDNVKDRIDTADPLDSLKRKKESKKLKEESEVVKNNNDVKEFSEQEKMLSEKLSSALKLKAKKRDSINYKDILGDLLADESEIKSNAKKLDDFETPFEEPIEEYEYINTNKKIKSASLTSLQDTLKEEGFKFKPYQSEIRDKEKTYEFLLINKAKLYLAIVMFLLSILQTSVFLIVLNYTDYSFLIIDFVIITITYLISGLMLLTGALPYITNPKKRKLSNFDFSTSLQYSTVTFIALSILTYSINSFFNLSLHNISSYLVTLFLPIITALNLITAAVTYKIILNNKSLY